jgi:hypothetical protein
LLTSSTLIFLHPYHCSSSANSGIPPTLSEDHTQSDRAKMLPTSPSLLIPLHTPCSFNHCQPQSHLFVRAHHQPPLRPAQAWFTHTTQDSLST